MADLNMRTHPLIVIAATLVILTCLLAIGVMTGIVPSPTRGTTPAYDLNVGTAPAQPAQEPRVASQNAYVAPEAPSAPKAKTAARAASPAENAGAGATSGSGASQSVAGSAPATAPAVCNECGSVTSVRVVKQQGEASMIGPAAGGLLGGVVGHQIGSGRGNTIATVVGAAGGAAAGTEIERRYKSTTHYVVNVRMNDGRLRHFNYASAPGVESGDKVRVVNGRLTRE